MPPNFLTIWPCAIRSSASGQPIRGADAERGGHRSAAEPQRPGATDLLLSSATRRLRVSVFAACKGRTGRRLIGEFWSGTACSGAQFGLDPLTNREFPDRFPRISEFLGRGSLPLLAPSGYSNTCYPRRTSPSSVKRYGFFSMRFPSNDPLFRSVRSSRRQLLACAPVSIGCADRDSHCHCRQRGQRQ